MIKKNNAQEKAIQTISGQLILVACPGAGKTTTLLRRINYMITKRNINPLNILMITFTKAAADEMNQQTLLHNPIKDLNCMRLLLSLENCRDTKIISCLIV